MIVAKFRFAILYKKRADMWTYTSCILYSSQNEAVQAFPYKDVNILATFKIRTLNKI